MSGRWLLLLAVSGCYAPAAPSGAPCSVDDGPPCPSGQVCVAETCVRPGEEPVLDAALDPDADAPAVDSGPDAPPDDLDSDSVPNDEDNCPLVANVDQRDHDEDDVGDRCDGCPHLPAVTQVDTDADGVGDACDPRPGAADTIALFEGFTDPWPTTWTAIGPWDADPGEVQLDVASTLRYALMPPLPASATSTVTARISVDGGSVPERGFGIGMGLNDSGTRGIGCQLGYATTPLPRLLLVDIGATVVLDQTVFEWRTGQAYQLTLTRTGTRFTCTVTGAGLPPRTVDADATLTSARYGLRSRGLGGAADYLLLIDNAAP